MPKVPGEKQSPHGGDESPRPVHWQGHNGMWMWYEQQIERLRDMMFHPEMFMFQISQANILDLLGRIEAAPDGMTDSQRISVDELRKHIEGAPEEEHGVKQTRGKKLNL